MRGFALQVGDGHGGMMDYIEGFRGRTFDQRLMEDALRYARERKKGTGIPSRAS